MFGLQIKMRSQKKEDGYRCGGNNDERKSLDNLIHGSQYPGKSIMAQRISQAGLT